MKAVVVFSGGQDSTTCLGLAIAKGFDVYPITFDYGQRHAVEVAQAVEICKKVADELLYSPEEALGRVLAGSSPRGHNVEPFVVEVKGLDAIGDSALLSTTDDIAGSHSRERALPASFVPGRNALMLTLAHAYAQRVGAERIIAGVCQTDYSGYPDCRRSFIKSLEASLNIGYEKDIRILTPLMHLTKAQTFAVADDVGFLEIVLRDSHTCYEGVRDHYHDWGYGCGECPACKLRKRGYAEWVGMRNRRLPDLQWAADDARARCA